MRTTTLPRATLEQTAQGFLLELSFDHRDEDPFAPGDDAIAAHSRFRTAFREVALDVARLLDPLFTVQPGEQSEEEDSPWGGSSGRTLYGTDQAGLSWSWRSIDHAADETMSGTWHVLGLPGRVTLSIERRNAGHYRFVFDGPVEVQQDALDTLESVVSQR